MGRAPILGAAAAGHPVAFEAAYGWGWLVELRSMRPPGPFEALSRIYPGEYGATGEIEIRRVFEPEGFDAST